MVFAVAVTSEVAVAVSLAAFLIGLVKGGFSGVGPLITILVATAVPTTVAIGVLLPLLMIGDVFALWAHWGTWDRAIIGRLLPGAAGGVLVASLFLRSVSEDGLRVFLAFVTIGFVVYRLAEPVIRARMVARRPEGGTAGDLHGKDVAAGWGLVAGGTAGITSTVAHVGGPPVSIHLLAARVGPRPFVATNAALFFVVNWLKVPGYIAADLFDTTLMLRLAPTALLIPPGILAGRAFVTRVNQKLFDGLILVSLVAGAILLLIG